MAFEIRAYFTLWRPTFTPVAWDEAGFKVGHYARWLQLQAQVNARDLQRFEDFHARVVFFAMRT